MLGYCHIIPFWRNTTWSTGLYEAVNARRWPSVGLMLGRRRRRWPNIIPTLGQRFLSWMLTQYSANTGKWLGYHSENTITVKVNSEAGSIILQVWNMNCYNNNTLLQIYNYSKQFCETQWRHRKPFKLATRWKHWLLSFTGFGLSKKTFKKNYNGVYSTLVKNAKQNHKFTIMYHILLRRP